MNDSSKQIAVEPTQQTAMIAMIEKAAINPAVDIDKMERLLQMQITIMDKQAEMEFNSALVEVQKNLPFIPKDAQNKQTNSVYARLETINQKLIPIYTKAGFSLSFGKADVPHEGFERVICDVSHTAGHTRQYYYDLPIDDSGLKGTKNKTGVHASGSTTSYARRYLTMMIFNLVIGGEDNDGNREPVDTIADDQVTELHALCTDNDILESAMAWLKTQNIEKLSDIYAGNFENIKRGFNAKIKSKNK